MDMAKPIIRFKGYLDDWEQRKLGEVFKEYSEKNHTELPALTIIQGGGTVKREDSDRILMYDESNLSSYKMVRKDDFIVHLRSFEGGLEKSSLDGIVSPAYHTFHSDVADSRFYYPYFRSHEFIKHKLVPHVYGIRDGRSIDIDGMKTIEIPYTSMEEQRKIGGYLESLDTLITLHQRKCDETKKLKKYMLQKMFPQNGEKVPEIRFLGFTDDWEQRKLGATNTFFTDGNYGEAYPKSSDMTDSGSGIPFLTGGNLKDGKLSLDGASYITPEKHSKLTSGHLFEDDIVIAVRGSLGALGYVNTDNSGWNINSQLAILRTDKSELYGKFLIQYLLSWTGQNELLKRQTGSALKQLPIGAIKDVEVPITSIAEQGKIGEYFADLDNLITLHQRELENLQNIKRFMLGKMFV
ncbi:restriction endonuclease subunit S [Gallintestinimicrobium sp.]|uniref:restriction endonuclease subunit S n=1 Tax=Gallintestinimicrobium sp. TaxID=2981655 RepID=UPI00399BA61E